MRTRNGTITVSTRLRFNEALQQLRCAFAERGLRIVGETDISARIKQTLGLCVLPCRILYVWPTTLIVEQLRPALAVILPLHVVVGSRGEETDIFVLSVWESACSENDWALRAVKNTQTRVHECLEAIGMPPAVV